MSSAARPAGATVALTVGRGARARRSAPLLSPDVARLVAFAALASFGALQWAQLVHPLRSIQIAACVAAAVAAGALLARERRRARPRRRVVVLVAVALLLIAGLAAGIAARLLLDPRAWGELAHGVGGGLAALPGARVPYSGLDRWTATVLLLGASLLTVLAALLAFAPRRGGARGSPIGAAVALGSLYAVPSIEREVAHPFLAGGVFALLLAAFLWLERVERAAAPYALAAVLAACLAGLALAPRLDGGGPLIDYETLAQSLTGGVRTTYDWNHSYGPLNWPRDGREVLRVKAPHRAYWKAAELTGFDGLRWVQDPSLQSDPTDTPVQTGRGWQQTIDVTIRALKSSLFVGSGTTLQIRSSPLQPVHSGPGMFHTEGKALPRGSSYEADVYDPRPSAREMRASTQRGARATYPEAMRRRYSVIGLPDAAATAGGAVQSAERLAVVPLWGQPGEPVVIDPSAGLHPQALDFAHTPYARAYALAQRLKAHAATPYDYMRAIERHLADGYTYSETPPLRRYPLESFLFVDKTGYCQQFSGAMALLLRLGGVPARVAAGFSPGVRSSSKGGQWIVRDLDAHSWVEVYFPGIGWVTRDPTPSTSPARSQTADLARVAQASPLSLGGDGAPVAKPPAERPHRRVAAHAGSARSDGAWSWAAGGGAALALAGVAILMALGGRRRRARAVAAGEDPDVAELECALRRSRRAPRPDLTLDALAARLSGSTGEGYVRALRDARFGGAGSAPTRGQRAGLRRELARGRGAAGRLRAWWALPPRL